MLQAAGRATMDAVKRSKGAAMDEYDDEDEDEYYEDDGMDDGMDDDGMDDDDEEVTGARAHKQSKEFTRRVSIGGDDGGGDGGGSSPAGRKLKRGITQKVTTARAPRGEGGGMLGSDETKDDAIALLTEAQTHANGFTGYLDNVDGPVT